MGNPRFCDHDPMKYKVMGPLYWCPKCQEHYTEDQNPVIGGAPKVQDTTGTHVAASTKLDLGPITVKGPTTAIPVDPTKVPLIPDSERQPVPDGCPKECEGCQYRKGRKANPGKYCVKYKMHLWDARKKDCIYKL